MNVKALQQFLRSLAQAVSASGAKSVAGDLERVGTLLEPFQELTVAQFADFLARAEQYARTGVVPTTGRPKSVPRAATKVSDPEAVQEAARQLVALYDQLGSPEVTYGHIAQAIKDLDKRFNKEGVFAVVQAMGVDVPFRTKKDALAEIQRRMTERKGNLERDRP